METTGETTKERAHGGELNEKEKEAKNRGMWFLLVRAQSERSVSAIVPGLAVTTVRLLKSLFIYVLNARMHATVHVEQGTLQLMILQEKKETKATSASAQPFKTCVTASPSLGFSCYKTRKGKFTTPA